MWAAVAVAGAGAGAAHGRSWSDRAPFLAVRRPRLVGWISEARRLSPGAAPLRKIRLARRLGIEPRDRQTDRGSLQTSRTDGGGDKTEVMLTEDRALIRSAGDN